MALQCLILRYSQHDSGITVTTQQKAITVTFHNRSANHSGLEFYSEVSEVDFALKMMLNDLSKLNDSSQSALVYK